MKNELRPTTQMRRDGTKVIVSMNVPKQELTPRDIINNINGIKNAIATQEQNDKKNLEIIEQAKGNMEDLKNRLADHMKFHDWAMEAQESKFLAVVDEIKDEVVKKINENFKPQEGTDDNKIKFYQYQSAIATHKTMAESVAQTIINKNCFTEPILKNPWI